MTYDPTSGDILERNEDAFDNLIIQNTTIEADLAGHYPYTPERYRVLVNGTLQEIQYDGFPTEFSDNVDGFTLAPQASGDVVTLKTAEQYRYVVSFVTQWSFACALNQSLGTGDSLIIGFGDPDLENATDDQPGPAADGWFVIHDSADSDTEAELAEYRAGTKVDSDTVTFADAYQNFTRLAGQTNWYNAGETTFQETSIETTNGTNEQTQQRVGSVANATGKGPETANKRFTVSLKAGNSTSAGTLELDFGSIAIKTFGTATGLLRAKTFEFDLNYSGTTGEFEPLLAVRTRPDDQIVTSDIKEIQALKFSANDDLELLGQVFNPSNVREGDGTTLDDADFSTPPELSATNSVLERSTAVEQIVDATGTLQTSTPNPGGYQVGYASLTTTGQGGSTRQTSRAATEKRQKPVDRYFVLLAKSGTTGDILGNIQFDQDF